MLFKKARDSRSKGNTRQVLSHTAKSARTRPAKSTRNPSRCSRFGAASNGVTGDSKEEEHRLPRRLSYMKKQHSSRRWYGIYTESKDEEQHSSRRWCKAKIMMKNITLQGRYGLARKYDTCNKMQDQYVAMDKY